MSGYRKIKAICADFCSEEYQYLEPDSRIIQIPKEKWNNFMIKKNSERQSNKPLYVGIRNSENPDGKKIYFGKVEPNLSHLESVSSSVVLPSWCFSTLNMDFTNSKVDIVLLLEIPDVHKIVLKGDNSSYINTDIRSEVEFKFNGWNCLNLGETFYLNGVQFTVTNLLNSKGKQIEYGAIYQLDEVILEFDEPDDLIKLREERERQKKIEEEFRNRPRELQRAKSPEPEPDNRPAIFKDEGLKISSSQSKPLTKQELLEARLKRLG